jgi:hypothetical protein
MSSRLLSASLRPPAPLGLSRLLAASALPVAPVLHLLDDRLLADIGLTRSEALSEAGRAPWDAPAHWKG